MAVLELAQRLRGVWRKGETLVEGKASSGIKTPHDFGWRDLYDILIKWRQYSEVRICDCDDVTHSYFDDLSLKFLTISQPNDPVWWVDLLSPEQFEEGFGSHTPMITGQTNVIRYYPMFKRAFPIMKSLIPEQCKITEEMRSGITGKLDFFICTFSL